MTERKFERGMDARKELCLKDAYKKEYLLRMKWFSRNEPRLIAYAEKPNSRIVPDEVKEKMISDRQAAFKGVERYPNIHAIGVEDPPPVIDPNAVHNLMKPVEPAVRKLLYSGMQKDGRRNYLARRVEVIPENKYYFPETTSFGYGWNMWNSSKTATSVRYGRCQVIQASFYRRNGVGRDPDWYREPAVLNPSVCTGNC